MTRAQIRVLLFTASILWLFHCAFVLAVDLKTTIPDWTYEEIQVQKILNPIFDLWTSTAVLGLLAEILRHPLWSDPTAIIDGPGHGVTQQPFYFQPQAYQQPYAYQYGQQPAVYQQPPPGVPPDLVTASPVHEAGAALRVPQATESHTAQQYAPK